MHDTNNQRSQPPVKTESTEPVIELRGSVGIFGVTMWKFATRVIVDGGANAAIDST